MTHLDAYEGIVRVLFKEKGRDYKADALYFAERVKSRTFLEMLAVRGAKGKGTEDEGILARDREFQQKIAALREQISILEELGAKAPQGKKERVKEEMDRVVADYEIFIKEVELEKDEVASLIGAESVSVKKLQALLDPDTTLLEYYTAKDATYAWVVDNKSIKAYEIPVTAKSITAMVNDLLLPNISKRSRRLEIVKGVTPPLFSQSTPSRETPGMRLQSR